MPGATTVVSAATKLRNGTKRGGTTVSASAHGGAATAGMVARAGDIFRRGGVAMPSGVVTTRQLHMRRRRAHGARQRQAWRREDGNKRAGKPDDRGH